MKTKIYKVFITVSCMLTAYAASAQQVTIATGPAVPVAIAPGTSGLTVTSAPAVHTLEGLGVNGQSLSLNVAPMVTAVQSAYTIAPNTFSINGEIAPMAFGLDGQDQQDTTYQREMRKLQEQMRQLQKQMSDLRTQQYKKQQEDYSKRMETMREMQRKMNEKFKNFNYSFDSSSTSHSWSSASAGSVSVSGGYHISGDDYLKKKIASGEVKEKTKTYTKSYAVDGNDAVRIENRFGRVTVNTWAKKEVKVDALITVDADDDKSVQRLLDAVSVKDGKEGNTVSFRTNIDDDGENNWGIDIDNNHIHVHKVDVNYTIWLPAKASVSIENRFGGVVLPNLSGKVYLKLSNGSLIAGQLTNPENELNLRFGDANIESLNGGNLDMGYGKLKIKVADDLKAKLSFSSADVERLKTAADISMRYGNGLTVGTLDRNVKNINVDASFTKVLLNVNDDFNFDVTTHLGNFNYSNVPVVLNASDDDSNGSHYHYSTTKTYKGKVGKGSTDKTITIKSSYSQVKFE